MSKRDFAREILSKKSRLYPSSNRWDKVAMRLRELGNVSGLVEVVFPEFELISDELWPYQDVKYEIVRYLPIGYVTCIEGYFRITYADLLDHGAPFRENFREKASELNIKFDIKTALSLQQHSLSIGDFIAHQLPLNNLEDIDRTMSQLIGEDFLARIKIAQSKIPRQLPMFTEIKADGEAYFNSLKAKIKRLFDIRHIYCHELVSFIPDTTISVDECVEAAVEFLWLSETIVTELLSQHGSPPNVQ